MNVLIILEDFVNDESIAFASVVLKTFNNWRKILENGAIGLAKIARKALRMNNNERNID
jgi:hypothetical protein